jgi:hypothetical protein
MVGVTGSIARNVTLRPKVAALLLPTFYAASSPDNKRNSSGVRTRFPKPSASYCSTLSIALTNPIFLAFSSSLVYPSTEAGDTQPRQVIKVLSSAPPLARLEASVCLNL